MILADTSGLLALFNVAEPMHARVLSVLDAEPGPILVSPYVVAELDYLVLSRLGVAAELLVLQELVGGAYDLVSFSASDVSAMSRTIARFADHSIGVTDASIVQLAERTGETRVLTLDHRHFDMLRTPRGRRLRVLPD